MKITDNSAPTIAQIRRAVADYMNSEGCSCCRSIDRHDENKARLAKLLKVPMWPDKSGYNFGRFETRKKGKS